MTTQTRALPDLDEALDFEPMCETKYCDCETAAAWVGETPCGCASLLLCDTHRVRNMVAIGCSVWLCDLCGRYIVAADMVWRPL